MATTTTSPTRTKLWLPARAAARRLGVTNTELYRLIDKGSLPGYKYGSSGMIIRVLAADVEEYLSK